MYVACWSHLFRSSDLFSAGTRSRTTIYYHCRGSTVRLSSSDVRLRLAPVLDCRRYNLPTSDEVAVVRHGTAATQLRNIVLRYWDGSGNVKGESKGGD